MIMRYEHLSQHPKIFQKVTGVTITEFDELVRDVLPRYVEAEWGRLQRPNGQRAIGAGRNTNSWRRQAKFKVYRAGRQVQHTASPSLPGA